MWFLKWKHRLTAGPLKCDVPVISSSETPRIPIPTTHPWLSAHSPTNTRRGQIDNQFRHLSVLVAPMVIASTCGIFSRVPLLPTCSPLRDYTLLLKCCQKRKALRRRYLPSLPLSPLSRSHSSFILTSPSIHFPRYRCHDLTMNVRVPLSWTIFSYFLHPSHDNKHL